MAFKVQVLYRDGYAVAAPTYIMVGENDLIITDNSKSGCNSKIIKAFDGSKTEYFVAEIVDVLVNSANGISNSTSKSYYALIGQTGTDAPIVTLMNNNESDYLGDIVWTRESATVYRGTLAGVFMVNGTFVSPIVQNDGVIASHISNTTDDYIEIHTTSDDKLTSATIEIKVFYNLTAL